ncbi:capsule assembly Wzi family protein [Mucilaginibacter ginkgonis]|uniref:Capsule assembly protein Wzi n=1 Tax=Mucilaginibacter ginkgonis TaxID=2682091 RepID=A0A6I4I1S6_9SPHI|nr:capsule assembly Wzi family protein [Mucilaginibacter ginkgonis]QQL50869.1 hypothetical protein GO620_005265 [Mucilaginibacter ginkgonis]
MKISNSKCILPIIIALVLVSANIKAQAVFENPQHPIYQYLARQAQKGRIRFDDLIQPVSRKQIAILLHQLKDGAKGLTDVEKKELDFYLNDYSEFEDNQQDQTKWLFSKDQFGVRRAVTVTKPGFILRADPAITLENTIGSGGKNVFKQASGLVFWGQAGKHFSFQAYFQDVNEKGKGVDSLKQFTPETGIQRTANLDFRSTAVNYSDVRGNITYSWDNGLISVGKDQVLWGYGQNGRLVMSDKAPSYPFIRFDYKPLKWLQFNYVFAFLQSALIDSARTYKTGTNLYSGTRELYIQKYLASHSLTFLPGKGISLSIGESMVSSDYLDAGYLIPILFFKAYDQYQSRYKITTGSNGQIFFQASSRNNIPNTHLYATLFIDEIRLETAFDPARSRNQLGYNIGGSVTDVFIPYLTVGAEYTRINPFVYANLIPAQTYASQNYLLGDWIGQNSDQFLAWLSYNPFPRLTTSAQISHIRKGRNGSVLDQYFAEPQPKFLQQGPVESQTQFTVSARYELIHRLYLRGIYQHQTGVIRPALQTNAVPNQITVGVNYGF